MSFLGYFSVGLYLIMDIADNLKMCGKIYGLQKNMIPSLLIFLCNVLPRKNKFHACAVGKF